MGNDSILVWVVSGLLALVSIANLVKDWKKEEERRINIFLCFLAFVLVAASTFQSLQVINESKIANSEYKSANDLLIKTQNVVIAKQDEISTLGKSQQRKSDSIIYLYQVLSNKNEDIIKLQKNSLEQITGGNNKPILLFGGLNFNQDSARYQLELRNIGTTHIRDVNVWIQDNIIAMKPTLELWKKIDQDSNFNYKFPVFDNSKGGPHLAKANPFYQEYNSISPNEYRIIYSPSINIKSDNISFAIDVVWLNGAYSAFLHGKIIDSFFCMKDMLIYENNKWIEDEIAYFNFREKKLPEVYVFAGNIQFTSYTYNVYWHKTSHWVIAQRKGSIYYNLFKDLESDTKEKAPAIALQAFIALFGKF